MLWYTRESSVAVYVSNLPLIWPLMRELFPRLRSLTPGQKSSSSDSKVQSALGRSFTSRSRTRSAGARHLSDRFTTAIRTGKGDSTEELGKGNEMGVISRNESLPSDYGNGIYLVDDDGEGKKKNWDDELRKGGILMSTTIHVSEQIVDEHIKNNGDGEQVEASRLHSRDVEKGLGWAR